MKPDLKNIIAGVIGLLFVQVVILSAAQILWNWVMPSINIPKVNFLQITMIYVLIKLLMFDWPKAYSENKDIIKPKKDNS
jgi:hypothetical protein